MRRLWLAFPLVACGPAVDSGSGSGSGDASASTGGSTGGETTAAASSNGADSTGVSATTSLTTQGSSSSGFASSSSSGEPFEMTDVLGPWLCEGDEDPFTLSIVDYPKAQQLEGSICANWNGERDPVLWGPCGELTSHPLGGGTNLWIFAIINGDQGKAWTVSASLNYDVGTNSMAGTWSGPGGNDGSAITCTPI